MIDILLVCDTHSKRPWYRDRLPGIKKAFSKIDKSWKIIDIYSILGNKELNPSEINQRFEFFHSNSILEINKNFYENILIYKPRILVLCTIDNYIDFLVPSTISKLISKKIYISTFLGDDEFNYNRNKFFLNYFHSSVVYVKSSADYYRKLTANKIILLPNSCHLKEANYSNIKQKTKYDAILVGAPIANRPQMIRSLIKNSIKVAIFGSSKWNKYSDIKKYYHGYVDADNFDYVMSNGKLILAFLEDHISGKLHMNTKIWEAIRVGRLPITTHYPLLQETYGFNEKLKIPSYKNNKDLVKIVNYYLNNSEERISLSKKLFNFVKERLDYEILYYDYFKNLLDDVSKNNKVSGLNIYRSIDSVQFLMKLQNEKIFYFPNKDSKVNADILGVISILKKTSNYKAKLFYFDRIESGNRVRQFAPFISLDSVFFLEKPIFNNKLFIRIYLLTCIFFFKTYYIRQYAIISSSKSFFGYINRSLYNLKNIIYKNR